MSTLDKALNILSKEYGEIDNIKLLLGAGDDMTRESVAQELLEIAEGLQSGAFQRSGCLSESKLVGSPMSF